MTSGRRITVEADPRQRADRRACVSLLVLGILTLLMFGSMESAILRQSEGLGMGVAFMIIPLVIPFAIALVCARWCSRLRHSARVPELFQSAW